MSDALDFRFIVEDEDGNRNVVPVPAGTLRIGRQADNEICLPDRNVSRRHAKVSLQPDGVCALEDLNSYNGVFVNGERIQKTGRLAPGDTLRIGDFQLELRHAARRTDSLTNTAKLNLFGKEGTEPAGLTAQAAALANEATTPGGDVMGNERTDVSGRITAEPTDPGVPRGDADGADEPTSPGIEVTDRHLLDEGDGPDTMRDVGGPSSQRTEVLRRPGVRGGRDKRSDANGPEAPFAHLLCLSGERAGTPFPLSKMKIVIGRTEENDIALDHRSISREHSRVEWTQGGYRIVDLDSSNGTLVNNESYQQVELHAGDVVELGHIRLRFVAGGEPCVLSQEERLAVAKELRGSPTFTGSRWPLAIGGAGLACLVTVAVMYWTQAHAPSAPIAAPAPIAAAPQAPPSPVVDEAQSLMNQAQTALASRNYSRAQALATAALAIDPSRREAQAIVRQAAGEERAVQSLETATAAVDSHAWADAFNALQDLPPGNGHRAEAAQLMAQIKPALLRERIDEVKTALAAGDLDEVALLVDEVEALEPEANTLSDLRHSLEVARRRADGKGKAAHNRPPAAATAAATAAPRPPPHKASVRNKSPSPSLARSAPRGASNEEAAAAARAAYTEGTRLLAGSQTQKAIDAFGRCVAADKTFAMCYRALGIAYAKADNGPKAVHFYRLYLKVDPTARDASQVRQLLQQYNQQATEATDNAK